MRRGAMSNDMATPTPGTKTMQTGSPKVILFDVYQTLINVDVLIPQKLGIKTVWVKNPLTAYQFTHLFEREPKDMINLEEFVKLPEVIERILN